jgi:hypothetical protein
VSNVHVHEQRIVHAHANFTSLGGEATTLADILSLILQGGGRTRRGRMTVAMGPPQAVMMPQEISMLLGIVCGFF